MLTRGTDDEMLTPGEAAALLRISPRTLARYREDNIIPVQKYSPRLYRFRKSDIDSFLNRTRIEVCDYLE